MPFASLTYTTCLRYGSICIVMMLLILLPTQALTLPSSADNKAVNTPARASELQYKAAKDYFLVLERDTPIDRDRNSWLNGVRQFRRLYLADTKGDLAPSCLYMMGRMYRRMYQQFNLPIDLDESINSFTDVASVFPKSSLADDALFTVAEIERFDRNNPARAAEIYRRVIKRFPDGDKSRQALSRLNELVRNHDIEPMEARDAPLAPPKLVNVLPVQHWSSSDYTRIVIRASAPVQYTTRLLEKNDNQPRRLYLDFSRSYTAPQFRSPVPIQDGLLKQIRASQFNDTTVQVVLDIESISDYKIFNLKDPFRVVIDVRGAKKEPATTAIEQQPAELLPPPEKTAPPNIRQAEIKTGKVQEIFIILEDRKKVRPSIRPDHGNQPEAGLSLAQQLGLGVRRIVIDSGHGGKDPGAMAFGLKEKDIVLDVARRTAAILEEEHNYEVILTRDSDTFLPLEERTAIANTRGADLFVSIHVNAHPKKSAKGVETFYLNLATNAEAMRVAARENATSTHNISELEDILSDLMQNAKIHESSQLAEFVQNSLVKGLKEHQYETRNLGVKQAPFYVLIGAEMPAVLAEISFITNPDEARHLKEDAYLQAIAEQIAAGVSTYVNQRKMAALQL